MAALLIGFLVAAVPVLAPLAVPSANAASAADWDPGYIIDDSVFYDSDSMTANEVQSFLNSKVRTCRGSLPCLKDFGMATEDRPADAYCDGYTGVAWESAAQIIDKVARSCGISHRVLLVTLEKEQSLVTGTAPTAWNYQAAMGQGCPDFGSCNPATAGFFRQVYFSARQWEIYRLNPNSFGYREQRWNTILYNPNTSCGTKSVFIHNQATAALYIYTPYTPNAAALSNMYGVGDSCSTYGNRNFWRLFTDWFGNPRSYTVHPGFESYWNSRGGADGVMGSPTSYPVFSEANGQGWYQRFEGGIVYASNYGGTAFVFNNIFLTEYERQGGPTGPAGWPTGEQYCSTGVRCFQTFLSMTVSSTPSNGARTIWGRMSNYWWGTGGTDGALGAALTDAEYRVGGVGDAWVQHFERGVLVQGPSGIHTVSYGGRMSLWLAHGNGEGWIGWPTGPSECVATGCAQPFGGAVLGESPMFGVHAISGGFVTEWRRRGGLTGMGPAYNDLSVSPGGWTQNFGSGILAQSGAGFFMVPYGAGQALWTATGAQWGAYGWPQSERTCVSSMCAQEFAGGAITESQAYGTHGTFGGLGSAWRLGGGLITYGAALNDVRYSAVNQGGWAQNFGTGVLSQRVNGNIVFTPYGKILDAWSAAGGEASWMGWPDGVQSCDVSGCRQQFQNGLASSDSNGGVTFTRR